MRNICGMNYKCKMGYHSGDSLILSKNSNILYVLSNPIKKIINNMKQNPSEAHIKIKS